MATKRIVSPSNSTERHSTEAQPTKGTWSAAQKLAIIAEYESYPRGDPRRGELLRRVGAYTSHISQWRDQRDRGTLTNQHQPKPGRPSQPPDPQQQEIARLQRENARLAAELEKAQFVIAIQKKVAMLLGETPTTPPENET